MDSEIASEQTHSAIYQRPDHRSPSCDPVEEQVTGRLGIVASLTVITLLSAGLWAAIWAAASLAAAV